MAKKIYDLKKQPVIVDNIPIDQVVKITGDYTNDQYGTSAGIHSAQNYRINDPTGVIELIVKQDSNSLKLLTALFYSGRQFDIKHSDKISDQTAPAGFLAQGCVMVKLPPVSREGEPQDITFNFTCTNYTPAHSGAGEA
jgi:hypothetical protein